MKDPKVNQSIKNIVEGDGLKFEFYTVTTKDGYMLQIHRVFDPRFANQSQSGRQVIFLQHDLFGSSEVFILNDQNSLA